MKDGANYLYEKGKDIYNAVKDGVNNVMNNIGNMFPALGLGNPQPIDPNSMQACEVLKNFNTNL